MDMKNTEFIKKILHIIAGLIFIYIFIHLLSMRNTDVIFHSFTNLVMSSSYCLALYVIVNIAIFCYVDKYIGVLLFIILVTQYRTALKEYFVDVPSITPSPSVTYSFNNDETAQNLLNVQLGIDERFKMDEVVKDEILRQIKSQIDFDPYKSNLAKGVIYEIYNKYYDNNIFKKLKNIVDDSQDYVAAGNFTYLPKNDKVDYDLIRYQNLNDNIQFGINPIVDGIANRARNVQK